MQYKFDRKYLKKLLKDSRRRYLAGEFSEVDYTILKIIINKLIYGDVAIQDNDSIPSYELIKYVLNQVKIALGKENIEKLLNLCNIVLENTKRYNLSPVLDKHTSKQLVTNTLCFYQEYDESEFDYLTENLFYPCAKLEIVKDTFLNRKIFDDSALVLPYYNLDFIRIIQENKISDYAALCHEFRHILDAKAINKTLLEFNSLRETNPIYMELYYSKTKSKGNTIYDFAVKRRVNFIRRETKFTENYLYLLLAFNETNTLNTKMLEEIFGIKDKKELKELLLKLKDKNYIFDNITYLLGFMNGIKLCNIAEENIKEAKQMVNKICKAEIIPEFIPKNLMNELGEEFTNYNNFVDDYKKFIKK